MKEVVLITGITGHIGNSLCRYLAGDGRFRIRGLFRDKRSYPYLEGLGIEKHYGDILDYDSFLKAAKGCDYIFQLAALYSHNPNKHKQIYDVAKVGTENFIRICKEAGLKKTVYTSSVAALGVSDSPNRLVDETCYVSGECEIYTKAKLDSQLAVEEAVKNSKLPIVIVLPSTIVGENDYKITPSNQMILNFINSQNLVYIDGGINIVHISDVVNGHIQALKKGNPGEKYIIGGTNVTIYNLMSKVASLTGRHRPFIKLPRSVIYPLAAVFDLLVRITNKPALISKIQAKTRVGKFGFYSIEKAKNEFNYSPMDLDTALVRSLSWYEQRGLCGPLKGKI